MNVPLEISYHNMEKNDKIENLIINKANKLRKFHSRINGCRVAVETDQKRRQSANPYRVRIDITIPPAHEIAVEEKSRRSKSRLGLAAIVRRAFRAAERRIKELKNKQDGRVKSHPEQEVMGIVHELNPAEGTGIIKSVDYNRDIHFKESGVIHNDYDRLEPGTGVRFSGETDSEGTFRATTVEIVDKPGSRLKHSQ